MGGQNQCKYMKVGTRHLFSQRRRRWGGGRTPPPSFGISVAPIRTKGSRLCPPYYYVPPPPSFGTMRHLCLLYVILIWRNFLLCSVSNRQITHKCKLWNFTTEHDWNLPDSRCDRSTSRKIDSESSFPYKLASSHIQWHLTFWLIVLATKGKCSQRVNFFGYKKLVFQTVLAQIIKKRYFFYIFSK